MLKFFKKHPPKEGEEREKLKKELFGFCKCAEHGFPSKPSALAWDPKLRLMAMGTKNGVIKVFGAPGVEFSVQHKDDVSINALYFLEEQGRLISLCSDNSLSLWEVNVRGGNSVLEQKKDVSMESSKQKTISSCCLSVDGKSMLLGTEGGNIHTLDVEKFTIAEQTIMQDIVMQDVPDDFKVNPGAVEAIAVHPTNPDKFLIGYNRGLIVYWDNKEGKTEQTYNATQQLESLSWNRDGESFMSAHADGSYIIWSVSDSTTPKEPASTPYGPFPCKAITKVEWKMAKADPFIIFAGGMPRASYGDRHTISVMQGENHVVFDFTSKVIDFITMTRALESDTPEDRAEHDEPHALMVLLEEELVLIDLDSAGWPVFRLPYLHSVHSSAITCSYFVPNVAEDLWTKICDAGEAQFKNVSKREWPINGGRNLAKDPPHLKELLLTGHEDGTVRFWDASGVCLNLLYKLSTASIFGGEVASADQNMGEDEEWPPFRKVGTFDPYSDDPRLGIQKISLCSQSGTLVVAGTAGQVLTYLIEREEREQEVKVVHINIVGDRDGFVWKGHEPLTPREGDAKFAAGFQATSVLQIYPPAACTALALHSEWQLVAAGNAHGFCLFDYVQKKEVLARCTLNPNDMTGTSDTPMSRRKSLKKSLRESFRRLRRRRSERRQPKKEEKKETPGIEVTGPEGATAAVETGGGDAPTPEARPVERAVEARSSEDSMASMIRCLYFADTFVVHGGTHNPSLWVGTNGGHVYIYTLTVPDTAEKRASENVTCLLAKEIKLRHRAPVINMAVLDSRAKVLPPPLDVQHGVAKAPDMSGQHSVVLVSEEQIKSFTLPALKPRWKVKLTAIDGSRIRKVAFVNFRSKSADNYTEFDIACLSNLGDLMVYSVTSLRQQLSVPAIKKEDIHGISSFVFTANGQGLYLHSSSEFCRVSLSPRYAVSAVSMLELKEGMREQEPDATGEEDATAVVEVTEEGGQYNAEDITQGLDNSQLNSSSQADTTGDITVDSIRDVAAEREAASNATPVAPESSAVDVPPAESVPAPVNNHVDDETKTTTKVELNDVADKLKDELCIKGGGDMETIVTVAVVEN